VMKHDPSKVIPLIFKDKDEMGFFESMRLSSANSIAKNDHNLGLLVIKDGKVVHESYNSEYADENSLFFSMSMSKSLIAYSISGLVCSGKVDINRQTGDYTDELRGTTWDTATVRDNLMMASGAKIPVFAGQIEKGSFGKATKHIASINEIMLRNGERVREPGSKFNYLSVDTAAVERVIAGATKKMNMLDEFNTQVWDQVGAERDARWNIDKAGAIHAYAGFSATLRDWGRLGLWSLAKNKEDSCEGKFHKEANTQQIVNHRERQGKAFKGYGYQVWIRNDNEYWWVGHGGQRVGINTKKNAIIVAFSYVEDYMDDLYALMDSI
jgi:CubicO group peptidase (beta-lactamase class C family)